MCGLTGIVSRKQPIDLDAVERMATAIQHRGPDDHGLWVDNGAGIALAHRRLAILDLSPAGHQPMVSGTGRFVIVFNGEIYNHLYLRQELEQAGSPTDWRGHSDTETILAGFDVWGVEGTLQRMTGMFAFAVWDRKENMLTLARDRLGEKPLYYGWSGNTFLFCSELKALRQHAGFQAEINRDVLALFLRYGYIPSPYCIYRGIYKLSPGTLLKLQARASCLCPWGDVPALPPFQSDGFQLVRFWSLADTIAERQPPRVSEEVPEQIERLEDRLRQTIAGQMIADVPTGAFLSGGVDSSTIVALMQAESSRPINTFTIGFHEADYDEARYARNVARHLGTEHTEFYVTHKDALAVVPKLPLLYDEPFADSSQIPTFLVSQLARQHVTVVLSGDGGDELFGGYKRYFWASRIYRATKWLPAGVRNSTARTLMLPSINSYDRFCTSLHRLFPSLSQIDMPGDKIHKVAHIIAQGSSEKIYDSFLSHWKHSIGIVHGAKETSAMQERWYESRLLPDFWQRMMFMDTVSYLPDDILVKLDRAAMSVSLEARVPFLDHHVVEAAWRIPLSLKVRNGQGKWILRQILHKYVPENLFRRPKMGFGLPLSTWVRGPLREWAEELLAEKCLREQGFFHATPIREKWREHLLGTRNWSYLLWDVLMFQAWLEAQSKG